MSIELNSPTSSANNIYFITSNKDQRLLVINDYIYRCNKHTGKKKYWVCMKQGCTFRAQTDENDNYLCGHKGDHDHESSLDLVETKNLREKMKNRVINELTPINLIYEEELAKASLSTSALANFPTNHEIYQTFAKIRQKIVPQLPSSCLFSIPAYYKLTLDGQRFLLLDESRVRRERLLVYASDLQLDILFNSSTIYMDGTFSKTPPHFTQLYIIHAVHFDICVPCVYALTVNKKSSTYRELFSELRQIAVEVQKSFSPSLIITDFESGVLPVLKTEFPSAKHYGCSFHFNQAIFKHIQQLGLQQEYSNNELIRSICRKIMALALMPYETVSFGYDEIRNDIQQLSNPQMEQLLLYFDKQWLGDIDIWNVSTTDKRTNNTCEGYHNRMNHRIVRNHSNIWKFTKFMQTEEKRLHSIVIQWSAGAAKKANPRSNQKQNRLNTLYERYNNGSMNTSQLLHGLSLLIGTSKH